ncbi:MAG: hypothetical protein HFF18_11525 [Oscillospiraceae bacterium]|nr:hypothetical protein [Oscillospiraceae bacterium]
MERKKSFVIYTDYLKHIELLSIEQRGELLTAILTYADSGEERELDGMTSMAFSFIKTQMDRDLEKWEQIKIRRSLAGQKSAQVRSGRQQEKQQPEEISDKFFNYSKGWK